MVGVPHCPHPGGGSQDRAKVASRALEAVSAGAQETTLLTTHLDFLRRRAPEVQYAGRILFQELHRQHGYRGSYDTVKRFVQPLRACRLQAERATVRFETEPERQSQIDWGQARVRLRTGPVALIRFGGRVDYAA